MLLIIVLTFFAGVLTAFAPCVLPLLPVILGGGVVDAKDRARPYIIVASLLVSLVAFTLLLKVSTALIGIDPSVWKIVSGVFVIALGIVMLLPTLWARIAGFFGFEHKSQALLSKGMQQKGKIVSAIAIGAALGPVFSSCSPTYSWLIVTILPVSFWQGLVYLVAYCLGVVSVLLALIIAGRRIIKKMRWAINPYGWFQRLIAIAFITVGVFVITGIDKQIQTYFVQNDFTGIKQLESQLESKIKSY